LKKTLLALLLLCTAPADAGIFSSDDEDAAAKSWTELEAPLPPPPKAGGLVEFAVSGATTNRFLLDTASLSIGSDGVVRYTLVVRSPGGAENISFEGLRCVTKEQKFYAFARRDGSWSPVRDGQWREIESKDANRQHLVLFNDILCEDKARPARSVRNIDRVLRYGR
jgi:hypothetical protein